MRNILKEASNEIGRLRQANAIFEAQMRTFNGCLELLAARRQQDQVHNADGLNTDIKRAIDKAVAEYDYKDQHAVIEARVTAQLAAHAAKFEESSLTKKGARK